MKSSFIKKIIKNMLDTTRIKFIIIFQLLISVILFSITYNPSLSFFEMFYGMYLIPFKFLFQFIFIPLIVTALIDNNIESINLPFKSFKEKEKNNFLANIYFYLFITLIVFIFDFILVTIMSKSVIIHIKDIFYNFNLIYYVLYTLVKYILMGLTINIIVNYIHKTFNKNILLIFILGFLLFNFSFDITPYVHSLKQIPLITIKHIYRYKYDKILLEVIAITIYLLRNVIIILLLKFINRKKLKKSYENRS